MMGATAMMGAAAVTGRLAAPPAGLWRRAAASLIDSLLASALWLLCAMWLALGLWGLRGRPESFAELLIVVIAVLAFGVALRLAYHVVFVGGCGQTPGRMALGIAVVDGSGQTPGYGRALTRWLGGLVSVLTLGLLSLPLLFTRERRGLGDWLAGTRVVLRARGLASDGGNRL